MLSRAHQQAWERDGYFILPGFGGESLRSDLHARAVELARAAGGGGVVDGAFVQPESAAAPDTARSEERVSKIFKLHRDEPVFRAFIHDRAVLDPIVDLLGPDLDCFLSQFIFKNPGALGQPWHQDSYYFRFDRTPQVGVWLAVTEATVRNGCLHVLPGSHREPVHEHVPDRREGANLGYVEIVDHDMSASVPVEMAPGDLLVFHSHLMHRSTDNESDGRRAAMVYHFAQAGTRDLDDQPVPINDWLPVRRRIATEIEIDAPLTRVWEVLTDLSRYPDWNPYLVRVDGEARAGADVTAHGRSVDGRDLVMPVRVVEAQAPRMRWQGGLPDRAQFMGDHFFDLEQVSPGRTRLHHYEHFSGALVGDIVGAGHETIRANFARMNEALRARCEAR